MTDIIVSNKIHYLGTNDRKKLLFENIWPLPNGVSYNSYLISDEKTALVDTLEFGSNNDYFSEINSILKDRSLDYLIVNHMEPDHAGMIGTLTSYYPSLKVVGNSKTFKMLEAYYNLDKSRFIEVNDNDSLDLGYHNLTFIQTPWVHWPETMMTYDKTDKVLFSCDAFGSFGTLNGAVFDDETNFEPYILDEMRRYYSNIVGKYSHMVQKAITKLENVPVKFVCPSHGLIWRKDPQKPITLYDNWSKHISEEGVVIAFASMYGNTEKMADFVARQISVRGVKNIRIFDVSKTHISYIISDIWQYKGVILGSCAYNTGMHPMMHQLCNELEVVNPKEKNYALFGSFSWSGGGLKYLQSFSERMSWNLMSDPVELIGTPSLEKMGGFKNMANKII